MRRIEFTLVSALTIVVLLIAGCNNCPENSIPFFEVNTSFEIQEIYNIAESSYTKPLFNEYKISIIQRNEPVYCILVDPNDSELLLYGFVEPYVNAEEYRMAETQLYYILFSESFFQAELVHRYRPPNAAIERTEDTIVSSDIELVSGEKTYKAYCGELFFHTYDFSSITNLPVLKYDKHYITESVYRASNAEDKIRGYLRNVLSVCIGEKLDKSAVPPEKAGVQDQELIKNALTDYLKKFDQESKFIKSELEIINIPCYEAMDDCFVPHRLYRMYGVVQSGKCSLIARVYYNEFVPLASIDINTETIAEGYRSVDTWDTDFSYIYFKDSVYLFDGKDLIYDWRLSIPMGKNIENPQANYRTFPGRITLEAFIKKHGGFNDLEDIGESCMSETITGMIARAAIESTQ